ncbi:molt-inhibiting hormone [Penaeus indicus]|uniref:Molt-inhibiting hormone n=3 Tax=Penaeus TaxID=133894 RepID=M5AAV1_PENSE|nr:molt-inhibiting hormone isoform X1 [Penaeus chinensis]AAR89516.1 molt-inhibiting hormone 1 [Penaeus monodon]AGU16977.1 molt-inhibiting hormone [Penaeus semisulcatus]QMX76582.1 molt inhibiting hormone [Penaeus indicus]ACS88073.1 molt-inhibiting hormone 1 [Penaeus monodon]BAN05500.1 molt-inhibiting hormone [Penaeus semisulcatus]
MYRLAMKTWLAIVIVVVGTSLFFDTASASFIDGTCRGVMGNRDIYKKVVRVCEDCTNIFRLPGLDGMCRDRCFYNEWFLICLKAANREDEIEKFKVWISILNAGQ